MAYHSITPVPYCLPIHPKALLPARSRGTENPQASMSLMQIEAEVLLKPSLDRYPFIEIWLDYLEDELTTAVTELTSHPALSGKSIIFTMRTLDLSEPRHSIETRSKAISSLNKTAREHATKPSSPSLMLDLDIRTQTPELSVFDETRGSDAPLSLITSYHDFEKTMDREEFERVIAAMSAYAPRIFKVATYCNTPHDATFLLEAGLRLRDEGRQAVTIGMGPYGVVTRIFGTLWGNTLCYCPVQSDGRSAPGQYSIDHYDQIFKLLEE